MVKPISNQSDNKRRTQNEYRYLLFYKPYNVLSQFTDQQANQKRTSDLRSAAALRYRVRESSSVLPTRQTLKDYIPVTSVYPVGRLDQDSEGLMLLTNNGRLQDQLSNRRFQHPRTYWVQVEGIPTTAALRQLGRGVKIQDYQTRPTLVQLLPNEPVLPPRLPPIRFRKSVPTSWLEITLTEGRNRQVRKMTAAVGFPTLRLVRVGIAHLRLDSLEPGQWRDLTLAELEPMNCYL
ncbi:MAG: pseudouridine synthase [Coleofasciculaceae cyanobacterium]